MKIIGALLENQAYRLILLSFLMLFIELTLIRWVGSNVYYLFFFSNFILLASFLGMGIGFLRTNNSVNWFRYSPIIFALIIFFCYMNSYQYHATVNPLTDNLDYSAAYFKKNLYPVWLTLPIIFCVVVFLMSSIAGETARLFQRFEPLMAYRLEVLGSLIGIIVFSLLSLLQMSPVAWGSIIILLYIPLLVDELDSKHYGMMCVQIIMLIAMLVTFMVEASTFQHYWSSYYKIEVQEYAGNRYVVNVNGLAQQVIESVEQRKKVKPFYLVPYKQIQRKLENVLVIGAGTGGDVALALAQGAKHVDAVEIDSMLYQLGRKFNPNHPYHDPRVQVYIDDGRAFLQQNKKKYDMIIFALTDSLSLIPGQSSLRLENYLYTMEGLTTASQHLKEGGMFTIYNYYGLRWLVDRLANTLTKIYQHIPCVTTYSAKDYWATVLSISNSSTPLYCEAKWQSSGQSYETPITDNHPFMYLKENTIPTIYVFTLLLVLLASMGSIKLIGISYRSLGNNLPLFLMGCAFLLLETKNVINFALFFGTTWFVNALVFLGILLTVYLSIEITRLYSIRYRLLCYIGLVLSLLLAWFIPNAWLLSLSLLPRCLIAIALAFAPILMANLLFADQFRKTTHSTEAFGANLLGAVLGGLLEYSSLIIGYQNLFLLIIAIYIIAIALMYPRYTVILE